MPDNSGAVNLGDLPGDTQERLAAMAEETDTKPEAEKRKVLTAFLVLVDETGNPEVVPFAHTDLEVAYAPGSDLVYAACSTLLKDLQVTEAAQGAAQLTAHLMRQQAEAMIEQQQQAAIQQQLQRTGLLHG